ncbi:MAG: tRNA (cytidine/uridine-2'-O-)-methyltransferase TrmJ [Myxococcota bacterium]|nr:tRNA (cytidine/uridine-2'-O-)-methyltransferase TrmJ [Myxococcota bacterium]
MPQRPGQPSGPVHGYAFEPPALLKHLRVVVVEPHHGGNVGAIARAMKNFGFSRLTLVGAHEDFRHAEMLRMAVAAADIVESRAEASSLEEAVNGCILSVGTTSRLVKHRSPARPPEEAARALAEALAHGDAALVLGPEFRGLSDEELDLCGMISAIPAASAQPSLNLSQAACIYLHEIQRAAAPAPAPFPGWDPPAPAGEQLRFIQRLEETLFAIGYLRSKREQGYLRKLRDLVFRLGPDRYELDVLYGVLKQMRHAAGRPLDRRKSHVPSGDPGPD